MIELVQSEVVRSYELTYLLPTSLTSSEVAQTHETVKKLLAKFGATIKTTEEWGKKELAYAIRHSGSDRREAFYMHLVFSMPAQNAQPLEREMQLNTQVMRHLIVLEEATAPVVAETSEGAAA